MGRFQMPSEAPLPDLWFIWFMSQLSLPCCIFRTKTPGHYIAGKELDIWLNVFRLVVFVFFFWDYVLPSGAEWPGIQRSSLSVSHVLWLTACTPTLSIWVFLWEEPTFLVFTKYLLCENLYKKSMGYDHCFESGQIY